MSIRIHFPLFSKSSAFHSPVRCLTFCLSVVSTTVSAEYLCDDGTCQLWVDFDQPGVIEASYAELSLLENCDMAWGINGSMVLGDTGTVLPESELIGRGAVMDDTTIYFGEDGRVEFDAGGYIHCDRANIQTFEQGQFSITGASSVVIDGAESAAVNIAEVNQVNESLFAVYDDELAELSIGDIDRPDYARPVMDKHDNAIVIEADTVEVNAWSALSVGTFSRRSPDVDRERSRFVAEVNVEGSLTATCQYDSSDALLNLDLYCLALVDEDYQGELATILETDEENLLIATFSQSNQQAGATRGYVSIQQGMPSASATALTGTVDTSDVKEIVTYYMIDQNTLHLSGAGFDNGLDIIGASKIIGGTDGLTLVGLPSSDDMFGIANSGSVSLSGADHVLDFVNSSSIINAASVNGFDSGLNSFSGVDYELGVVEISYNGMDSTSVTTLGNLGTMQSFGNTPTDVSEWVPVSGRDADIDTDDDAIKLEQEEGTSEAENDGDGVEREQGEKSTSSSGGAINSWILLILFSPLFQRSRKTCTRVT